MLNWEPPSLQSMLPFLIDYGGFRQWSGCSSIRTRYNHRARIKGPNIFYRLLKEKEMIEGKVHFDPTYTELCLFYVGLINYLVFVWNNEKISFIYYYLKEEKILNSHQINYLLNHFCFAFRLSQPAQITIELLLNLILNIPSREILLEPFFIL